MRRTFARVIPGLLSCLTLAAASTVAQGDIIYNAEPNDTFATAQVIPQSAFALDYNPDIGTGGRVCD